MLTLPRLIVRNLAHHWRGNVAVLLGVAVSAAVLTGSLLVGDSLRGSLRARAERQLNGIESAYLGTRLVRAQLADELPGQTAPVFLMQGSIQVPNDDANAEPRRIGQVTVLGIDQRFAPAGVDAAAIDWNSDRRLTVLSSRVAKQLGVKPGDTVEINIEQRSNIPRSSLLGRRNEENVTKVLRLKVAAVLPSEDAANDFSLVPSPSAALNVFVPLKVIQDVVGQPGRVNALLARGASTTDLDAALRGKLTLDDWGLSVKVAPKRKAYVSVEAQQLVLDPRTVTAVEKAALELKLRREPTAVYLANWIARGDEKIPYSIVAGLNTGAEPPLGPVLPPGSPPLADDEIVLTAWNQSPIQNAKPGDSITLTYFLPELEAGAREATGSFRLRAVVPIADAVDDPDLTPPFPGVTDKASIGEWDPPFPYDNKRIRPRDETYWNKYRTTPKAFITLPAAVSLFGTRFGSITSLRIAPATGETPAAAVDRLKPAILKQLDPNAAGLVFDNVRERLLTASRGGQDFGLLFLGFSFFLIAAALMLVGLMFRLSLDRRAKEIGLLLATGYAPWQVRRLLLSEGFVLAALGSAFGVVIGLAFNRGMLALLAGLWPDPEVGTFLRPHASLLSFLLGFSLTVGMALFAIFLSCRGLVRVPPPALLRGETVVASFDAAGTAGSRWGGRIVLGAFLAGIASIVAGGYQSNPDFQAMSFFSGGGLLLTAALAAMWVWMKRTRHALVNGRGTRALARLGARNAARNPLRSLLTASLLAAAAFLLVAVESFRRQPDQDFLNVNGGSGGFNLMAESSVPLFQRFDQGDGRAELEDRLQRAFGGSDKDPRFLKAQAELGVLAPNPDGSANVFPLRLRGGDDASCLNLYQAGRPRLLGVPDELMTRGGFQFSDTEAATPEEKANPWLLLKKPVEGGAIPVVVEQNTAMWMLKTAVGGELTLPDESGRDVKFRIVGTLVDSPFQSELLLADEPFRKLFPHDEGYRSFLIRTPPGQEARLAGLLDLGLSNYGFQASPTRDKVAAYQAVIGAYLSTFQVLGGLGLLLGVLGLAVVILRGVWERLGELALLRAFGYRTLALHFMLLAENALLLAIGLTAGVLAALASVAPHVVDGASVPWLRLAVMLGSVVVVGLLVAAVATVGILRVPLIPALRRD